MRPRPNGVQPLRSSFPLEELLPIDVSPSVAFLQHVEGDLVG